MTTCPVSSTTISDSESKSADNRECKCEQQTNIKSHPFQSKKKLSKAIQKNGTEGAVVLTCHVHIYFDYNKTYIFLTTLTQREVVFSASKFAAGAPMKAAFPKSISFILNEASSDGCQTWDV